LMCSTDNGRTLIPTLIHLPHAQKCSDQLGVPSMPNPALSLTLRYLNVSDLERLHQELKHCPSGQRRVDKSSTVQEHSSLYGPPPVQAYPSPSEFRAVSFNTELYQAFDLPCDDQTQPGRILSSCASDDGLSMDPSSTPSDPFLPHHRPFPEEYVRYGSEIQGSAWAANSSGRMPAFSTQVSRTHFDATPSSMTQRIHEYEPYQSESTTHAQQHTSTTEGMEVSRDAGTSCTICGKQFHAKKAVTRHMDDRHSKPKKCHHANCNYTCIGKRKLHNHLHKTHGADLPSRRRATLTRKVAAVQSS
jgi:hypothetical protein